ncbi:MAG: type II secretion system protein [Minisyncoccota bacterium]
MKKGLQKGFTLIELLVVIAIIGILSSVVLASLNSARNKGSDAAIKASLANARAQAEIFYDTAGNYTAVCTTAIGSNGIQGMILSAAQKLGSAATVEGNTQAFGYSVAGASGTLGDAVCHDAGGLGWAAVVSLKTVDNNGWCVDSQGAATQVTTLAANDVTCN